MHPPAAARRIRRRFIGAALAAMAVAVAGVSPAQAATGDVTVLNRAFVPATVTVEMTGNEPGFTAAHAHAVWTMGDAGTEHTVTFDGPGLVSSGPLGVGKRHEVLIYAPGTYPYRCTIHPGMTGTVVVTPEAATTMPAPTAPSGVTASPAAAPAGPAGRSEEERGGPGAAVFLGIGSAGLAIVVGAGWLLLRRRQTGRGTATG